MACSFILKASGDEEGFSSIRYRIDMASDGVPASKAWAIESVVAGRYDVDIVIISKFRVLENINQKLFENRCTVQIGSSKYTT